MNSKLKSTLRIVIAALLVISVFELLAWSAVEVEAVKFGGASAIAPEFFLFLISSLLLACILMVLK